MSMITLDDDTAVDVAKKEIQKLSAVMRAQVQARLLVCHQDKDPDGNVIFIEPPDLKWYLKEYRNTLKVEAELDAEEKRDEVKTAIDIMKIMSQQTQIIREDKEKFRREIVIDIDTEGDSGSSD